MKKTLLALAVLSSFAGAASAQSAVTIYGSFDGGLRDVSHVGTTVATGRDDKLTMGSNGTYNSNRIGFKGVEDLGGGLNAHFVLESGFNTGTGTLDTATTLFNRSAYVGLGGAFGSVDLGRQYSVNFKTIGAYDPFFYKYTAIVPLAAQGGLTRLNNDVQYTGTFGGAQTSAAQAAGSQAYPQYSGGLGRVTVRGEYALGEQTSGKSDGSAVAVGVVDEIGPFVFGGAYTKRNNNVVAAPAAASFQTQKDWTVGLTFLAGAFKASVGYADNKQETGTTVPEGRTKDEWVGGSFNITPAAALTLAYYRTIVQVGIAPAVTADGRQNLAIFGATYALSKRTNIYADIDNAKLSGVAITNGQGSRTGMSVGVNHLF